MGQYLDYYKILDELKGKEGDSRLEQLDILEKVYSVWRNRAGNEAELKQKLVSKAIEIFKDEGEYGKFRQYVLKERYEPFVQGIKSDGVVTEEERRDLEARAKKEGFSDQEIDAFILSMNISVSKPQSSSTKSSKTQTATYNKTPTYSGSATGATKPNNKDKAAARTFFSTTAVSVISGIYILHLLTILTLTTWEIIGLVMAALLGGWSVAAIKRKENAGYLFLMVGLFIILNINLKIFFTLIPILISYVASKSLFKLYPDSDFLVAVIPASACVVAWLGYGLVSGELQLNKSSTVSKTPIPVEEETLRYATGIITVPQGAKIRSGPSTNYSEITALPKGHSLKVFGKIKNSNWYKVEFTHAGKMKTGYIYASLIHLRGSVIEIPVEQPITQRPSDKQSSETSPGTELVQIRVNSTPKYASLYVNGRYKGQTPMTINVPVGQVTLSLKKSPNYKEIKKKMVVTESSRKEWKFDLQLIVPNLAGTWKGQFGDKPLTTVIQTQDGNYLRGYNQVTWSQYPTKTKFKGTINPSTRTITLKEQGESFGAGKFTGKLSSDGKSMSGKWEPYGRGQALDWSVRFYSSSVDPSSSNGKNYSKQTNASKSKGTLSSLNPRKLQYPKVQAQVSNADDKAILFVNGAPAISVNWGEGPNGKKIGHQPGHSGWVDIGSYVLKGTNYFRFWVRNNTGCCWVSGKFEVRVNGKVVLSKNFKRKDSSAGIKYNETFELTIP